MGYARAGKRFALEAVVRLGFVSPAHPDKGGEIVLLGDNRLLFVPSERLLHELDTLQFRASEAALKWGTSLVVGLTALGANLFIKNRKPASVVLFGAAGIVGAAAYEARNYAARLAHVLHTPQQLQNVQILMSKRTGNLTFVFGGAGLRKMVITISADEFGAREAHAFVQAVADARNGNQR